MTPCKKFGLRRDDSRVSSLILVSCARARRKSSRYLETALPCLSTLFFSFRLFNSVFNRYIYPSLFLDTNFSRVRMYLRFQGSLFHMLIHFIFHSLLYTYVVYTCSMCVKNLVYLLPTYNRLIDFIMFINCLCYLTCMYVLTKTELCKEL